MYERYWGFKEKPFQNTPDPRFFYESSGHQEAIMKILYAVEEGLGAGMLTGVFGCGKTLISQTLIDKLPPDKYVVAIINNPQLEYIELLRAIVRRLKTVELPIRKDELSADSLLEFLGDILEDNARDGRETVLIIDEAHIIKDERIFEALRLLLNFQRRDKFLLTLLLFGQPELRKRIQDNKQLEQRIALKGHLEAFDKEDTKRYIEHRLFVVKKGRPVFDNGAFQVIYSLSGGIPRKINRICDLSLLVGMHKKARNVNSEIVKIAVQNIGG